MPPFAFPCASRTIGSLAHRFKDFMIKKIHRRRVQHRLVSAVAKDVVERLEVRTREEFDSALEDVVQVHPDIECLYVLDHSGVQMTDTMMSPSVSRRQRGMVFDSSAKGADHSLMDYFYALVGAELKQFTSAAHVSLASGGVCRTMSAQFQHRHTNQVYVLCMEVSAPDVTYQLR